MSDRSDERQPYTGGTAEPDPRHGDPYLSQYQDGYAQVPDPAQEPQYGYTRAYEESYQPGQPGQPGQPQNHVAYRLYTRYYAQHDT